MGNIKAGSAGQSAALAVSGQVASQAGSVTLPQTTETTRTPSTHRYSSA
jgi:hypothetical protein